MSEQSSSQEQTLRDLLAKIGHPLLEVRTRSLRSLCLKLRGGLVAAESLIHEQALLSDLLQWFNFPDWGSGQLPLGLLEILAEHEVAAVSLVDMGAVEFLSQLRTSCHSSLHPSIDDILEKLLRVPNSLLLVSSPSLMPPTSSPSLTVPCVPSTTPLPSHQPHTVTVASSTTSSTAHDQLSTSKPRVALGSWPPDAVTSSCITTTNMTSHYIASTSTCGVSKPSDASALPTSAHPLPICNMNTLPLYSETGKLKTNVLDSTDAIAGAARDVAIPALSNNEGGGGREGKWRLFPWLRLSVNDIYILKATESHIQTTDGLENSCLFLETVLFHDFPPELFLQRPALLKVLLSLLERDVECLPSLCPCLSQLSSQLARRIASLEASAHDHHTFNGIHIHTQQGLTTAAATDSTNQNPRRESHDLEQLTQDMLIQLMSSEMTLSRYCSHLLASTTSHITTCLTREGVREGVREGEGEIGDEARSDGVALINACLQLTAAVVDVIEAVGKQRGLAGVVGGEESWGVEHLCTALSHSLSLWRHISNKSPPSHAHISTHLQLACHVTVSLAHCLQRVLTHCDGAVVPLPCLAPVVSDVVLNGVVMLARPRLHRKLSTFLEKVDPSNFQMSRMVEKLFALFQSMSVCMMKHSETTPTLLSPQAELELAVAALPGLWTFHNCQFIGREINLTMRILHDRGMENSWSKACSLLLQLLAHGSHSVQATAYQTQMSIISSPSPSSSSSSSSSSFPSSLGVSFLDELCCHGTLSPLQDVSRPATAILSTALSTQMTDGSEGNWMTDGLVQRLPYIEASFAADDRLFAVLREFLDSGHVSKLARQHSLLRLLFSTNQQQRNYACDSLMKLQASLPSSSSPSVSPSHDILVTGKSTQDDIGDTIGLERSDIARLLDIVKSSVMDDLLKRSALQQLAMLLKDVSLHGAAVEEGIVDELLDIFKPKLNPKQSGEREEEKLANDCRQAAGKEGAAGGGGGRGGGGGKGERVDSREFWKPCLQCLQRLVMTSAEVRSQLSGDECFLMEVFRVSVECANDPELLHISAILLANLLFSPCARWDHHHTLQLPQNLLNRVKFTFPVGSYEPENPHKTPCLLTPAQISHLRFPHTPSLLYHVAMAGGVSELLRKSNLAENIKDDVPTGDVMSLRILWPPSALWGCLSHLREARSHVGVTYWVDHMTLINESCQYDMTSCDEDMTSLWGWGDHRESSDGDSDDWETTFGRFLEVQPATPPDRALLSHLLHHLTTLLNSRAGSRGSCLARQLYGAKFLSWLVDQTAGAESACLLTLQSLMNYQQDKDEGERQLEMALLHYYTALSPHLSTSLPPSTLSATHSTHNDPPTTPKTPSLPLLHTLCVTLGQLSATHHDSLPSLHTCVTCLTHLMAGLCSSGTGFCGEGVMDIYTRLAISLREVVSRVLAGRGEMTSSFMGRGVLLNSGLALSLLLRGVASVNFPHNWYQRLVDKKTGGFSWLQDLTTSRDPLVRSTGYSILASLCGVKEVAETLTVEWAPGEKFGLWGTCMSVGCDTNEWRLVRQQGLLVLVSLTALCHRQRQLWEQLMSLRDQQELSVKSSSTPAAFLHEYPLTSLLADSSPIVTAPALQLMGNLCLAFPDFVHSQLEPLADLGEALIAFCDLRNTPVTTGEDSPSHTPPYWLNCCALDVLRVLVIAGSKVILDMLLTEDTACCLCQLLTVGNRGSSISLCVAVMRLMECVLHGAPPQRNHVVLAALLSQWTAFTAILHFSLLHPSVSSSSSSPFTLHTLSLSLLHSLLVHKLRPPRGFDHTPFDNTLTALLDSEESGQSETESDPLPSGSRLCSALIEVYEGSEVTLIRQKGCGQGAGLVSKVLRLLLASSQTAKRTTLKGGLLDSSLEAVKALYSHLTLSTTDSSNHTSHKNKEPVEVSLMCEGVDMIKCLLYHSSEMKLAALRSGLVAVVGVIWPLCTVSASLARAVLDMLTVFTAGNGKGKIALAASSKGAESLLFRIASHASHCLTSHRSCVAARMTSSLASVLAASMTLMTNCVLSSECRRVLKKVGFLCNFLSLSLRPPRPSSSSQRAAGSSSHPAVSEPRLWLKMMVNLTFSADGQQMVFKLPGAVNLLLDLHWRPDLVHPSLCLLVLRNLCFHGPGKTLLVENENFISVLTGGLESGEVWVRAVTASAIWALTYNCAKIKKGLRSAELGDKLGQLRASLSLQQESHPTVAAGHLLLSPVHQLYDTNLTNALHNLN